MAFSSQSVVNQANYELHPSTVYVPLVHIDHITAGQRLGPTGATLFPSQLLAPLIVSPSGAGSGPYQTWTLPGVIPLAGAYGGTSNVVLNDYYNVPVLNLGADPAIFTAGTGGTGTKSVAPYNPAPTVYNYLVIQFTNISLPTGAYSYAFAPTGAYVLS